MRLTTVAVAVLLVCASVAPSAVALGTSVAERPGPATSAGLTDQADFTLQTSSESGSESNATNQSNSSLGLRVSSFVHSTSTETSGVVENEMWAAGVTRNGRPEAVDRKVTRIREQLSTLQTEREKLKAAYQAGEISRLQYQSRLAQLNGRLVALSTATDATERAAKQLNTEPKGLQSLREDIREKRAKGGPGLSLGATAEGPSVGPTADGNESTTDSSGARSNDGSTDSSSDGEEDTGNTTTTATASVTNTVLT